MESFLKKLPGREREFHNELTYAEKMVYKADDEAKFCIM